jgi:hypothetical protein
MGDEKDMKADGESTETVDQATDGQEPASAPAGEPSHEAVGIGVVGRPQVEPDHHGQDGGREEVWGGTAQRAMTDAQEQRLPSMSQNNADEVEKVSGIVAQTRADVADQDRDEVRRVLAQRIEQAGVSLSDAEIDELTDQVTTGD